jgi:chemotaxis protein CheD
MLPLSKIDISRSEAVPQMFTDTGVPALIQGVVELGGDVDRLVAKVAGAASLLDEQCAFNIGERNYSILRKVLWKKGILIGAEDVGGTAGRSMYLYISDGRTVVRAAGKDKEL